MGTMSRLPTPVTDNISNLIDALCDGIVSDYSKAGAGKAFLKTNLPSL